MASDNKQLAASGLVGALTSLIVGASKNYFPNSEVVTIISIGAGIFSSIAAYELLTWLVIFRMNRTKDAINKIVTVLSASQKELFTGIREQIDLMKANNAPASSLKEIEKMQIDASLEVAKALSDLQKKNIDLIREIAKL